MSEGTMTDESLQKVWKEVPPGTKLVTEGNVEEGDLFYIEQLGIWAAVPKAFWGTPIGTHRVVRGKIDLSKIHPTLRKNWAMIRKP